MYSEENLRILGWSRVLGVCGHDTKPEYMNLDASPSSPAGRSNSWIFIFLKTVPKNPLLIFHVLKALIILQHQTFFIHPPFHTGLAVAYFKNIGNFAADTNAILCCF